MKIEIKGFNINYYIINDDLLNKGKDLLVFLHEGLGSIPQWKGFPEVMATKMQLPALVYDRIGYGESDFWINDEIKSKFLHNEADVMLPALINELGITNNIILFGHSDGGTIALIHASNALPQVKAAIIEAPHVLLEQYSLLGIRKAREILNNEKIISIMNRYHQGRAAMLIDKWTAHWLEANDIDWEAKDKLKKITMPLLLIQGENDDFGTFLQIDTVSEYSNSEIIKVEKIKNCGHVPHLEKQDVILALVNDFIKNKIDG